MQEVLNFPHSLVVRVVKRILGDEFLQDDHKYRVSMEILVVFVATLLHMGLLKENKRNCRKVFKVGLLGDLSRVLRKIEEEGWIRDYLEDDGFTLSASEERITVWVIEIQEVVEDLGPELEEVEVYFPRVPLLQFIYFKEGSTSSKGVNLGIDVVGLPFRSRPSFVIPSTSHDSMD